MKTIKRIRIGKCDKTLWVNRAETEMMDKLTGPEFIKPGWKQHL